MLEDHAVEQGADDILLGGCRCGDTFLPPWTVPDGLVCWAVLVLLAAFQPALRRRLVAALAATSELMRRITARRSFSGSAVTI